MSILIAYTLDNYSNPSLVFLPQVNSGSSTKKVDINVFSFFSNIFLVYINIIT